MPRRREPVRMTRVELVTEARGGRVEVSLRAVGSGRVLFNTETEGDEGAIAAVLAAERRCSDRGYVLVMPTRGRAREREDAVRSAA